MSFIRSISGVRGVVGDTLTPDVIVRYAAAFAEYSKRGKIVIGRDGRITGKIIGNLVSSTLLSMGCDVVALGIAPTPTIAIAQRQLRAAGGISITASHNPMQWNGLKFIGSDGMFLSAEQNQQLWTIADKTIPRYVSWEKFGKHSTDETMIDKHISAVLQLPYIKADQIKQKKFKVVVDCINAAGGVIIPLLLKKLGCNVIEMNCDVSGIFSRTPEPLPENLDALCERVVKEKADLGVAVDPDVDRLALITEKGEPFGEEYTITSVVKFILAKRPLTTSRSPLTVVVNLSTTRAVDDIAKQYDATVVRTPVGEINVAQKMKECGALIGGEGSGGVILPAIHYGRDAVTAIGLLLQQLAEFSGTLSELKTSLPQYSMIKSKLEINKKDPDRLLQDIVRRHAQNGKANMEDGLRLDYDDSWIHLRKSNTEPIIRIIAEAPAMERAQDLVNRFKNELQKSSHDAV